MGFLSSRNQQPSPHKPSTMEKITHKIEDKISGSKVQQNQYPMQQPQQQQQYYQPQPQQQQSSPAEFRHQGGPQQFNNGPPGQSSGAPTGYHGQSFNNLEQGGDFHGGPPGHHDGMQGRQDGFGGPQHHHEGGGPGQGFGGPPGRW